MKKLLVMMAAVACLPVLVQCSGDAPPPAGSVRLVNTGAQKLLAKARVEESKKNYDDACDIYEDLVELYPVSLEAPQARFRMAQLYEMDKDYNEAFDQYQKLIERHPDSPLYAKALQRQKEMAFGAASGKIVNSLIWGVETTIDPKKVTEWLNKVRDNAPYAASAPQAMNVLGSYLAKRDRISEAIEAYQKLVDEYPNSPLTPTAQLNIATLYRQASGDKNHVNVARAQEAYEDYLQRYPNSVKNKAVRADLQLMKKELVAQQLEVADYYQFKMKDIDAAIFCYQEVMSKAGINPEAAAKAKARLKALKVLR